MVRKLLAWLSFPAIDYRRTEIIEPHEKTFRWAFQSKLPVTDEGIAGAEFTKWPQEGNGLYWIQGILGSGKSSLMRYIFEHSLLDEKLQLWAHGQPLHTVAFYFKKIGTSVLQKSLSGLYRTILVHLIKSKLHLAAVAFPDFRFTSLDDQNPPAKFLQDALQRVLKTPSIDHKFCFFIDGLDEYEEGDSRLKTRLATDVLQLAKLSAVKIVVASRPEASFALCFARCPRI
jgi:hypothetical protein